MTELQKKKLWIFLLGALVVAALVGVSVYLLHPTTLIVAVSPADGDEAKLISAYGDALRQRRMDLRVHILPCDTLRQSAEALQNRRADLAVVRPDVLLPIDGLTLTVLHEDAAIFIAPASANLSDVSDLGQHKLGVIIQREADLYAVTALLSHYDLAPPKVTLTSLTLANAAAALGSQQVDAIALFAAPGDTGQFAVADDEFDLAGDQQIQGLAEIAGALEDRLLIREEIVDRPLEERYQDS